MHLSLHIWCQEEGRIREKHILIGRVENKGKARLNVLRDTKTKVWEQNSSNELYFLWVWHRWGSSSAIILQALVACSTRQAVQLVIFPIGPVGWKSESSYGIQPLYAEGTSNRVPRGALIIEVLTLGWSIWIFK